MNQKHLIAILQIRWQMTSHQFARAGKLNAILSMTLLVLAAIGSISSFGIALVWGQAWLAQLKPVHMLYVWDGLIGLFLFMWMTALMIELQRSEMVSLNNLLHLPVSLSGAFFLNYLSSLLSFSVLLFLPGMLGVCMASVMDRGVKMLILFPLLAGFLLMVTAVTYQLRGWLARMMQNKRRRGTVMAIMTIGFVMMFQIPNMINMSTMGRRSQGRETRAAEQTQRDVQSRKRLEDGEIDPNEFKRLMAESQELYQEANAAAQRARTGQFKQTAIVANLVLPIGWLPYGASAAAGGRIIPALLCVVGMLAIGLTSLNRTYRSTLDSYTKGHTSAYRPAVQQRDNPVSRGSMLEIGVPLLSESQSAITMATIRSTLRAPEAKMALMTPLILTCVYGSMFFNGGFDRVPDIAKPLIGLGAIGMSLLGMAQFMLNMFGLDRHAFRAYVLMPVPRRDILLGKNMGVLPFAIGMCAIFLVLVQIVMPLHFTHFVATLLQLFVVYLIYFIVSNTLSIIAPVAMAQGSMKPLRPKWSTMLLQFLAIMVSPLTLLPALFAYGAELLAHEFGAGDLPVYLLLTLLEIAVVVWFYNRILDHQGEFLREREPQILEIVSKVIE